MRRTSAAAVAAAISAAVAVSVVTFAAVPAAAEPLPKAAACDSGVIAEDGMLDVPNDNVHEAAIDCAVSWGIAQGTGSGTYSPAVSVSRGQMASFMARLVDKSAGSLPTGAADAFTDDAGNPHEANINALAAAAVVAGTRKGIYSPLAAVNRGQMASFLVRTYEHRTSRTLPAGSDAFADDDGTVHEANINKAVAAGFARGLADGRYGDHAAVRRDQMASFLTRMLEQIVVDASVFGSCAPTTIAAKDTAELAVALPAAEGTVTDVDISVGIDGDARDLVLALDNAATDAGLLVGSNAATTAGTLTFRDGARQPVADHTPTGEGELSGTVAPVEPLAKLAGPYAPTSWTLLVLNAGDAAVHITGCTLSLRLTDAVMPMGATAPASSSGDAGGTSPAVLVTWLVFAGTPLLLVLMHPGTARRAAATVVCMALASAALVVAGPVQQAEAQEVVVPTHPWGLTPDGRVFSDARARYSDGSFVADEGGGLFTTPRDCVIVESCSTRLTSNPTDREPTVSPTGQQVAFLRTERHRPPPPESGTWTNPETPNSTVSLWVLDLRTGQERKLTAVPQPRIYGGELLEMPVHLTWSPDEQRLAGSTDSTLFTILASGGDAQFADEKVGTPTECGGDTFQRRSPSWSPDGARLVYTRSERGGDMCIADQTRALFSAPAGDIAAEMPLGTQAGVHSLDHAPDAGSLVVTGTPNVWNDCLDQPCPLRMVDVANGALQSTMPGHATGTTRARWSPSGTHLLVDNELRGPDGSILKETASNAVGHDLQCSKGNCLSGIALRVTRPTQSTFDGTAVASGALAGPVTGDYLFAKRTPGSHAVQVTGDGATVEGITCDDNDSSVSGSTITYRLQDSEVITCTVDLGVLNDRDGDDIPDDDDACPDDPLNECILDRDGDGTPNSSDPCPDDPSNTCTPPPPPPPGETCRSFTIEVSSAVLGLDAGYPFGRVTTDGSICRNGNISTVKSLNVAADDITPPLLKTLTEVFYQLEPDPSTVQLTPIGNVGGTVQASYDLCVLPLMGLGKAVVKLLKLAARFGAERLTLKAIDMAFDIWYQALKLATWRVHNTPKFDPVLENQKPRLQKAMTDSLMATLDETGKELGDVSVCIPFTFWAMELNFHADGDKVLFDLVQLPSFGEVTLATNAQWSP